MFIRLLIDEIQCGRPTETSWFNDRDEVYFSVSGSSQRSIIDIPRVSPPPPEDYYGLKAGDAFPNIELWMGNLHNGESAYLAVLVREQDNAQLPAIAQAIKAGALGLGAIFVDPSLGPDALNALKDAAVSLYNSLQNDGDQTIGAFTVRIKNNNGNLNIQWDALPDTAIVSSAPHTGSSKEFDATGSTAHYTVKARVEQPRLPMIVNRNSGKCLDVAGGSLADQANVQQYTIHGRSNQRWFLKFLGFEPGLPASVYPQPCFAIMADNSGSCLDVAGASTADQANVQQFKPHFGRNQRWILVPHGGDSVILNLHSRKALDVAGASTADQANIQQYRFHGGINQRWRLQY